MIARAASLVLLLAAPAAAAYVAGYDQFAHYAALGSVLAFHLAVQSSRLAPFALLLPFVYAAAAVTANFTDGVVALIVAVAAATGAASSLGYHRALLSVLAAVLIGSCEPAAAVVAAERSLALFAGCAYGALVARTFGRGFAVKGVAVRSGTALGYALLLAVLVGLSWFAARATAVDAVWWLPLAVAALGDPWLDRSPVRAVVRLALALAATLLVLALLEPVGHPLWRAACAGTLLLALVVSEHSVPRLQGFLITPVLVLLAADERPHAVGQYVEATLFVFAAVAVCALAGKGLLWMLRRDAGHAAARG